MKLSIITCTYNSEKYLQECIDSVIAQNLYIEDYEHIFIDGYSTDATKNIINKYKKKYTNVKLIERKPKGVYNAMNEGIKEAKGDYVLCLNSDDYLEKNVLKGYLNFIENTDYKDIYYAKMNIICKDKNKEIVPNYVGIRKVLFRISCNGLVHHPTVLVKRDVIGKMGFFNENKKICSDYGMRLKCLKTNKSFQFYDKIISNFVFHDDNVSSNIVLLENESSYFREKYFGFLGTFMNCVLRFFYSRRRMFKN